MSKWPYNTTQWRKLRHIHLSSNPLCVYCLEMGRITPGKIVDHINPVRTHPELAFDAEAIQTLCANCHESVKKREEARGKRIGCDVDGEPLGGW